MGTLATETWTGTNGAAWPAQWVSMGGDNTATFAIQGNRGRYTESASTTYSRNGRYLNLASGQANQQINVQVWLNSTGVEQYANIGIRTDAAFGAFYPNTGYYVELSHSSSGTATWKLNRIINAQTPTVLASGTGLWTAGQGINLEFAGVGTTISGRIWSTAASKPATTTFSVTDSNISTGRAALSGYNSVSSQYIEFDNFSYSDTVDSIYTTAHDSATRAGSAAKSVTTSNGVTWAFFVDGTNGTAPGVIKAVYTTDNVNWSAPVTIRSVSGTQAQLVYLAVTIASDDTIHLAHTSQGGQATNSVSYMMFTPNAARTAYTFVNGPDSVFQTVQGYSNPDITAYPLGTGWQAHILGSLASRVVYNRVDMDSAYQATLAYSNSANQYLNNQNNNTGANGPAIGTIDHRHTGDGRTVATVSGSPKPDVYVTLALTGTGSQFGLRAMKITYNSSTSWSFGTQTQVDSTRYVGEIDQSPMWARGFWDGTRMVIAGELRQSDGYYDLFIYDVDPDAGTFTQQYLLDSSSSATNTATLMDAGSATYDPSGNVYLFGVNQTGNDGARSLAWIKWTRSGATMGSRTVIDATARALPYISASRGVANANISYVYLDNTASPYAVKGGFVPVAVQPAGTLNLTGSGTVAGTGTASQASSGSLALTGSGTLAGSGTQIQTASGSMALTGSGTLAASGTLASSTGSLGLTGSGTQSATYAAAQNGTLLPSGNGTLTLTGTARQTGFLVFVGDSSLVLLGPPPPQGITGVIYRTSEGVLSATYAAKQNGALALGGSGSLTFSGTSTVGVSAGSSLYSFDFTGTNGDAFPAAFNRITSNGSTSINNNRGQFTGIASLYAMSNFVYLSGMADTPDVEILFDYAPAQLTETYFWGMIRQSGTATNSITAYTISFFPGNGTASGGVGKFVAGAESNVSGDLTLGAFTANTFKRVRFQAQGTTLRLRVWDTTVTEPAAWTWTGTDTSIATGKVGFVHTSGTNAADTHYIDNLTVTSLRSNAGTGTLALTGSGTSTASGVGSAGSTGNANQTETFTQTDGTAWPSKWSSSGTGGSATVVNNRGQIVSTTTGYTVERIQYLNNANFTDITITCNVTFDTTAGREHYPAIIARSTTALSGGQPATGIGVYLDPASNNLNIASFSGASSTLVGTAFTFTAGTVYNVQFTAIGSVINVFVWPLNGTKPTTPSAVGSDTVYTTTSGRAGFALSNGSGGVASTISFDDITITNPSTYAGSLTLSGSGTTTMTGIKGTTNASGLARPQTNLANYRLLYTDDFDTAVALGSFPGTNYSSRWDVYSGFTDTSGRGLYDPARTTFVADSKLQVRMSVVNGQALVSAPVVRATAGTSYAGQVYGRYSTAMRVVQEGALDGTFKVAFMLWPNDDQWPQHGEYDYPETDFSPNSYAAANHHNASNISTDVVQSFYVPASTTIFGWHVYTIEWLPGRVNYLVDGSTIGTTTTGVSTYQMRWTLQCETNTDTSVAINSAAISRVEVDWVSMWAYDTSAGQSQTSTGTLALTGSGTQSRVALVGGNKTIPNQVSAPISGTTTGGTAYKQYTVTTTSTGVTGTSGQSVVWIPDAKLSQSTATVVMVAHGYTGAPTLPNEDVRATFRNRMLDAGYILISPTYDATFGNTEARRRMRAAYDWLANLWILPDTLLWGESMGGAEALISYHLAAVPNIRAAYVISALVNVSAATVTTAESVWAQAAQAILDAYNSTKATFDANTASVDPLRQIASAWSKARIYFVSSTEDTLIISNSHSNAFVSKFASVLADYRNVNVAGGHTSQQSYDDTASPAAFFATALTAAAAPAYTGSLNLTGSGTAALSGVKNSTNFTGFISLTGLSVLSRSGTAGPQSAYSGTVALTGGSNVAISGNDSTGTRVVGTRPLTGSGSLVGTGIAQERKTGIGIATIKVGTQASALKNTAGSASAPAFKVSASGFGTKFKTGVSTAALLLSAGGEGIKNPPTHASAPFTVEASGRFVTAVRTGAATATVKIAAARVTNPNVKVGAASANLKLTSSATGAVRKGGTAGFAIVHVSAFGLNTAAITPIAAASATVRMDTRVATYDQWFDRTGKSLDVVPR